MLDLYQGLPKPTEKITDEMAVTLASGLEALVEVLKALGTPEGEH